MPNCPRCFAIVDSDSAYCGICGRPRIVESLRAPIAAPPFSQQLVLPGLLVVFSLWLVVTIGIAFLREFKAVRDSRELLAENHPQEALAQLRPFLADHPEHRQGLLLCGQAAIRIGLTSDAKQCLARLGEVSPDLAKQLSDDYRQILTAQARGLGCSASGFKNLFAAAEELGAPFQASVLTGLDGMIETCRAARSDWELWPIGTLLAGKGLSGELVNQGYVPAIGRALADGRYGDARVLAQLAHQVAPGGAAAIEAALDPERRKVSATVAALRGVCENLEHDPRYRPAGSWCFPAAAPPAVQAAKDGWGRTLHYAPLAASVPQGCELGFELTSYGGNGVKSNDRQSPGSGITCRFVYGSESWQLPNRFWLAREGR